MLLDIPLYASLRQAALWVLRGRRPIDEDVFQAAPISLQAGEISPEGPLRELVYALRSGSVRAKAGAGVRLLDGTVLITLPGPSKYDVPREDWWFTRISWNDSSFLPDTWNPLERFQHDERIYEQLQTLEREHQCPAVYCKVLVHCQDLLDAFPGPIARKAVENADREYGAQGRRGGRPASFDWDAFYVELIGYIHESGLPGTQAELRTYMVEWCQRRWGIEKVPSDTTLKEKIAPVFRRLRPGEN